MDARDSVQYQQQGWQPSPYGGGGHEAPAYNTPGGGPGGAHQQPPMQRDFPLQNAGPRGGGYGSPYRDDGHGGQGYYQHPQQQQHYQQPQGPQQQFGGGGGHQYQQQLHQNHQLQGSPQPSPQHQQQYAHSPHNLQANQQQAQYGHGGPMSRAVTAVSSALATPVGTAPGSPAIMPHAPGGAAAIPVGVSGGGGGPGSTLRLQTTPLPAPVSATASSSTTPTSGLPHHLPNVMDASGLAASTSGDGAGAGNDAGAGGNAADGQANDARLTARARKTAAAAAFAQAHHLATPPPVPSGDLAAAALTHAPNLVRTLIQHASKIGATKTDRQGMSRRDFKRKVLQEQLVQLIGSPGGNAGSEGDGGDGGTGSDSDGDDEDGDAAVVESTGSVGREIGRDGPARDLTSSVHDVADAPAAPAHHQHSNVSGGAPTTAVVATPDQPHNHQNQQGQYRYNSTGLPTASAGAPPSSSSSSGQYHQDSQHHRELNGYSDNNGSTDNNNANASSSNAGGSTDQSGLPLGLQLPSSLFTGFDLEKALKEVSGRIDESPEVARCVSVIAAAFFCYSH